MYSRVSNVVDYNIVHFQVTIVTTSLLNKI